MGGGRPQCAQPVPRRRCPAQFPDRPGCNAAAGGLLRNPVAESGGAVLEVVQVDSQETIPLGTISLDCDSANLDQLGMVNPEGDVLDEINDILKSCARVVYLIL